MICRTSTLLAATLGLVLTVAASAAPTPPGPLFFSPQPSPDGRAVLWESLERGGSVWLTDAQGGNATFVAVGHSPSWDGSDALHFVLSHDDGHQVLDQALYRHDLSTAVTTLVAPDSDNPRYATVTMAEPLLAGTTGPLAGLVVCLDPGHGKDTGAPCATTGVREDHYVLDSAYVVKDYLEAQGATVKLTRVDNSTVPALSARVNYSNSVGARAFVAIHENSAENTSAHGIETFHRDGNTGSKTLARACHDAMVAATGIHSRGVKADKAILGFYLGVLSSSHKTDYRTLTEGLFLSNVEDATNIANPAYAEKLSWGTYAGIARVLGAEASPLTTPEAAPVVLGGLAAAAPWVGPATTPLAVETPEGDGEAVVLAPAPGSFTTLRTGGSCWTDYRTDATLRPEGSGQGLYGLVARCTEHAPAYGHLVSWVLAVDETAGTASLVLALGDNDAATALATVELPAAADGGWRNVSLEVRGTTVTGTVDGVVLTAGPDGVAASAGVPVRGTTGLYLNGKLAVAVDRLTVAPVTTEP